MNFSEKKWNQTLRSGIYKAIIRPQEQVLNCGFIFLNDNYEFEYNFDSRINLFFGQSKQVFLVFGFKPFRLIYTSHCPILLYNLYTTAVTSF